jgi:hypothetical protein
MLKKSLVVSTVVIGLLSGVSYARGGHGHGHGHGQGYMGERDGSSFQLSELTDAQKSRLIFMVEEEKLARDVYSYLYGVWGNRVFDSITRSEQRHLNAINSLLQKYTLEIPSTLETKGKFENEELQELYDVLIQKGELSLKDALEVGIAVEEKDIADIKNILESGVPRDLERVYDRLLNGSYSHLNAFNRELGV